ncbi:MAG TPA: alpha/beta fold hydrolase [Vicinamibacteria bacterium]|nr:alpha/beta fold hydrolase [Vicinamibacteria bacterium]
MDSSLPLRLRLLGPFEVTRGGRPVDLPQSQKTRALLAYLAVTRRPHTRERLCGMFWDVADDPRGALRWSLSRLRVLDEADAQRIRADRETVVFDPAGASVDALEVREAASRGLDRLSVESLRELVAMFRGSFLEGLELPEFHEFEAWRVAEREELRQVHRRILRDLVCRLEAAPEEALAPARELVRLAPADERDRVLLILLLAAAGRPEEAEEQCTLGRRQIERAGGDPGGLIRAWRKSTADRPRGPSAAERDAARQEVRFCTAPDGVRIAYATVGQGPALVKTANWMSHLEHDWKSPLWRHLARELSRDFRLVRYDQRGNGLSDWNVEDFSLDACVGDLEAVIEAAGLERFALLGVSQGSRVAIAYAIRHPERVSHLVLYGGAARGWKHRPVGAREARAGLQALIREGWGRDTPAFRQVFTTLFMPEASPEQAAWFNELQRASTSAENAVRLTEATGAVDLTGRLASVRAPTLVLHATQDAMVGLDEARLLAAGIPGARFVALDSQNHLLLDDEPAFARFLSEVRGFLAPPS